MSSLRPLTVRDAAAVVELMHVAFADLDARLGRPGEPAAAPVPAEWGLARVRHLLGTDPGGAWGAERDGELAGAALAIMRDGVWGLSLLVVRPGVQSAGLGRALLERTLDYGDGRRGGLILSSTDPRAMRLYRRAGFELRPAVDAVGLPGRRPSVPPTVRELRWPDDRELVDAAGRHVRGAGHGRDITMLVEAGARGFVDERGGVAVHREGDVKLLAASRDEVAADLLRALIADAPEGRRMAVGYLTAGQDWAFDVALEAGLELRPGGPLFSQGDLGPLRPYVPSGAYL